MYYSIPAIHKAQLHGKEIDPSNPEDLRRCVHAIHQGNKSSGKDSSTTRVQRQQRISISFEADLFTTVFQMSDDEDEDEDEDEPNESQKRMKYADPFAHLEKMVKKQS